jgi:feruloyl-CoA synthase
VSFGTLRAAVLDACAPLVADAVLTGIDRDYVGAILFPALGSCAALAGLAEGTDPGTVVSHPLVRRRIAEGLSALAERNPGSASRVARAVLTPLVPSWDFGEITDKGSLNQRAVLDHRAELVEAIHRDPPPRDVLSII